jgi:hypothetical protein
MASVDTYLGFQWGVDKITLTDGDGDDQPQLLSAVPQDSNTIRMSFDIDMMFLDNPGSVLRPDNWSVSEQISGDPLPIYWVSKVSNTVVDVHTSNMKGVDYDVVTTANSAWDQPIDPANDDATFSGIAETYPTFISMRTFFGLDHGMQGERIDVSAPYLANQDPAPLETVVDKDVELEFDLLDAEDAIVLTSVQIWIEGVLAYDGSTDTFQAPYNGTNSARTAIINGHHFVFEKTSDYTSYKNISVRVYAEDNAGPPPFVLDETYTFRIEDYVNPVVDTESPTGIDINEQALVSFSCKDVGGSGVVQATIQVTMDALPAIVNGIFQTGYDGPSSSITANGFNGYDVVIDRIADHPSTQSVGVDVSCQDAEGNTGTLNWSFTVRDWEGPLVTPVDPLSGETNVDILDNIELTIQDDTSVDLTTVQVEIDPGTGYELAFKYSDVPQFKPGWNGPGSSVSTVAGVTTIIIDNETQFDVGTTVRVRVTAKDPYGNPARLS